MINFLNINSFVSGLTPITTTEMIIRSGEFHPDGLFSETIFGVIGSIERRQTFSFISLETPVIHPTAYRLLLQLDRKLEKFISTEEKFILDSEGTLQINPEGVTGLTELINLFPKIKFRGDTKQREKLIEVLTKAYNDKNLFVDKLPIIPPDLRPAYQDENKNWVIDELNNLYITIIRRVNQVKSSGSSGELFELLVYGLQNSIQQHDDYIKSKVSKKSGLIRAQMLGKRTDFSGRAVITPNPDLKINEIGFPFRMAVTMFEPFLIHRLLYSGRVDKEQLGQEVKSFTGIDLSVDTLKNVFKAIKNGDKVPQSLYDIIFEATEFVMQNRAILAKRDPVLHPESYRAYFPKLIKGNTIQICNMQVGGHNADFDGDQMAIYHPLTNEAQEEAKTRMMRAEATGGSEGVSFEISKEMATGLYILTKDKPSKQSPIAVSDEDLEQATDPYIPVKYRGRITTMGRAIVNSVFPPDFPFVDKVMSKKVANSLSYPLVKKYGDQVAINAMSKLSQIGFKFATIMAPSLTLDDLEIPDSVYQLKKKLDGATTEEASILLEKMYEITKKYLEGTGFYDLVDSGASKGWSQPMQILVAKGIIADPQGNILDPIKGSFSEGLTNEEYFRSSSGARKGMVDRALNTADTGYVTRKLVYLLNTVEAHPFLKDCGTKRTLSLKLDKELISRIKGRFILRNNKLFEFDPTEFKVGDIINLRTPIYCQSLKLCHTCYGKLVAKQKTPYVGVVAGSRLGERGTQLILRTFHTGGATELAKRDMLKDILDNDPLSTLEK